MAAVATEVGGNWVAGMDSNGLIAEYLSRGDL